MAAEKPILSAWRCGNFKQNKNLQMPCGSHGWEKTIPSQVSSIWLSASPASWLRRTPTSSLLTSKRRCVGCHRMTRPLLCCSLRSSTLENAICCLSQKTWIRRSIVSAIQVKRSGEPFCRKPEKLPRWHRRSSCLRVSLIGTKHSLGSLTFST